MLSMSMAAEETTGDATDDATTDAPETDDSADDTSTETDEVEEVPEPEETKIEEEANTMRSGLGAEIRLLQLERSLTRKVLRGEKVVAQAEEKGKDTATLTDLLNQLEALVSEVHTMAEQVQETDQTKEEVVEQFVAIKHEARTIVKQFQKEAHAAIPKEDRAGLKEKMKGVDKSALEGLNSELKELRLERRSKQVIRFLERLQLGNPALVKEIQDGKLTQKEIKEKLRAQLKDVDDDMKKSARAKIKKESDERNAFGKKTAKAAKSKLKEHRKAFKAKAKTLKKEKF